MAQNTGTLISASIRPNDSLDPIASAFSNEVKGGLHGYASISERNSIISERREWGMFVVVYNDASPSNNKTYQLTYGYANIDIDDNLNWKEFVSSGGSSGGSEWLNSVKSVSYIQPATPSVADRYLVGLKPGDSISGSVWGLSSAGFISEYNLNLSTWDLISPTQGMTVRVDNQPNHIYTYNGVYPSGEWYAEKVSQTFYIEPITFGGVTYSVGTTPSFTSYSKEMIFLSKFATTNIGTSSLAININNIGYVGIKRPTALGLVDLNPSDIKTGIIYSLMYDGSDFQITSPFSQDDDNYVQYYVPIGDEVTVDQYEQYWVYGDLTIDGKLTNYGEVIIANGNLILGTAGTFSNYGDLHILNLDITGATGVSGPTGSTGPGLNKTTKVISGVTYSLVLEDTERWLKFTNNSSITVTVPNSIFSDGGLIEGYQSGLGQITFTSSSVTLTKADDENLRTAIRGSAFGIKYESSSNAHIYGKLELL